ncbi:NUDIX domain-containing protein [Streptomyces sp. p1417]|uniref:NUDIX domain-containing protein n=1 Tax=Streptomyces typhae TaxID=2681492 RepID=A0A6L6WU68_9ACTN|nr:NUDIX domain-containing protein [Streptomyces typhae]MVO85613.1 NUDIX domain-containing protein [Streptomyces typhae]
MTGRRSAGLLLFRDPGPAAEVLVGHMGGPFWARRDHAAWSIPKGEHGDEEEPLAAAVREFEEELGLPAPAGPYVSLGDVRQAGGKTVAVWAVEADLDPERVVPGTFQMEWPRGSGRVREFPELDRVAWLTVDRAAEKLVAAQRVFLERLAAHFSA